MKVEEQQMDDHHCAVIERDRLKTEMADCDDAYQHEEDRQGCHTKVREFSKERETACKYS